METIIENTDGHNDRQMTAKRSQLPTDTMWRSRTRNKRKRNRDQATESCSARGATHDNQTPQRRRTQPIERRAYQRERFKRRIHSTITRNKRRKQRHNGHGGKRSKRTQKENRSTNRHSGRPRRRRHDRGGERKQTTKRTQT